MEAFALIKKFWPFAVGVLALAAIGYLYLDGRALRADLKTATEHAKTVDAANAGLAKALDVVKAQRVDNDAIAATVAAKLASNSTHETSTRTIIEKAIASDPQTKSWADTALPVGLRDALRGPAS